MRKSSREGKKTRDIALIETTRDIPTLGELLEYCQEIDVCTSSVEFWRESLTRLFGNIIVLQRGDLQTAEEWHEFAQRLAEGVTYKYSLRHDSYNDIWDETPLPHLRVEKTGEADEDIHRLIFEIPGSLPQEGTRGYFVELMIQGDIERVERAFFVHSDQRKALERAQLFVAEKYREIHLKKVTLSWLGPRRQPYLFLFASDNGQIRIDNLDVSEGLPQVSLIDLLLDHIQVKPMDQPWYAKFTSEAGPQTQYYTETNWEIHQITF